MDITAIEDELTGRVERMKLKSQDYRDDMFLTHLNNALKHGRTITIDVDDEVDFEYATEV